MRGLIKRIAPWTYSKKFNRMKRKRPALESLTSTLNDIIKAVPKLVSIPVAPNPSSHFLIYTDASREGSNIHKSSLGGVIMRVSITSIAILYSWTTAAPSAIGSKDIAADEALALSFTVETLKQHFPEIVSIIIACDNTSTLFGASKNTSSDILSDQCLTLINAQTKRDRLLLRFVASRRNIADHLTRWSNHVTPNPETRKASENCIIVRTITKEAKLFVGEEIRKSRIKNFLDLPSTDRKVRYNASYHYEESLINSYRTTVSFE
jgi:hypothetical protein